MLTKWITKKKISKRWIWALVFISAILVLTFFIWPTTRALWRATLFSLELQSNNKYKLLKKVTKEPVRESTLIESHGRLLAADVWRPNDNQRHAAAIISLGVDLPRNDDQIVRLGSQLARIGFVAVAADIPELMETRYTYKSAEDLVNIFKFTQNLPNVDSSRVGFTSFCIGAALSILAAEDPRIAEDVHFINTATVLFNLYTLSRDITTRRVNDAPEPYVWNPDVKSWQVLVGEFVDYLPDNAEKQLLTDILMGRVRPDKDQLARLSPDGRLILQYLGNKDVSRPKELWEALPEEGRKNLDLLSPSTHIGNLRTKTFVLVDGYDTYNPHTQSLDLVKALPRDQAVLTELKLFDHKRFNKSSSRVETAQQFTKLVWHITQVLLHARPWETSAI